MMLLLALVLAAEPAECRGSADCVISTFAGCCGSCCPVQPYATTRENDAAQQRRCAIVDCAAPACGKVKCDTPRPASALRAVCEAGRCVAVATGGAVQCSQDSDCRVDWVVGTRGCGPCGCCPGTGAPVAVPANAPSPQPPPRPLVKKDEKPPRFGLTPGGPPPPPPPNCSPCPAPPVVSAVCSANRCVLKRE